jgi:hypothetical protein
MREGQIPTFAQNLAIFRQPHSPLDRFSSLLPVATGDYRFAFLEKTA